MQSEIDSLRQQIATLQTELALKEQIQKMQSEIDTLKVQIIEITGNDEDYIPDDTNRQLSLVYPDYIQFIINYISLWPENRIDKVNSASLYQVYCTWCDINNKELLNNTVLGKRFSYIGITRNQARVGGGKREWRYILDRSKIMNMIHELFGDNHE